MADIKRTPEGRARIYVLRDPRNGAPMYVGKTRGQYMSSRLCQHMSAREDDTSPRAEWIRDLKALGLKPEMGLLEEVPQELEVSAEQFWIDMFRPLSPNLLNRYSPDLTLSRPEESRRKISEFRRRYKGWKHAEETKRKIGRAGEKNAQSKLTEDQVRQIRDACRDGAVQRRIAEKFNVCFQAVNDIVRRKTWGHLDDGE